MSNVFMDPQSVNGGLTMELVRKSWPVILSKLEEKDWSAQAFLVEGKPINVSDNVITIEYPEHRGFHAEGLKKKKELVIDVLEEVLLKEIDYEKINLEIKLKEEME